MLRRKLMKIIKRALLGVVFTMSLISGLGGHIANACGFTPQDKTIILDAGHGGHDSGAIGIEGKTQEKDLNLSLTKEIKRECEKRGIKVYLTRDKDEFKTLGERIRYANGHEDSDMYMSIHHNSHTDKKASGSQIHYDYYNSKGEKIARDLSWKLSNGAKTENRGAIKSNFYTRHIKQPTVLVETSFMSNKEDLQKAKENQKEIAKQIVDGVEELYEKNILK